MAQNDRLSNQSLYTIKTALQTLGETWVEQGATAFCVQGQDETCLWQYPDATPDSPPSPNATETLCSPIQVGNRPVGKLQVQIPVSMKTPALEQRLQADAVLVTHLLDKEDELEILTGELVDIQDQQLAFFKLTRSISDQTDLTGTLQTLARETVLLLKTKAAFLILAHGGAFHIAQCPLDFAEKATLYEFFAPTRRTGEECLLYQTQTLEDIENVFIVPITIGNKIIAGLGLINKEVDFTSPDLKLARAIAEQAGIHIEKVLLLESTLQQARFGVELDMAATIQNQLLPQKIPEVAGLGVYGKLSQARQVGGDFYIFGGQSGQGLIFAVGDVSGKGISSALMMAITRTVLHSHANTLPPLEAGEILTFANTDLYDDYTQVTMFATVFVGCYDPESRYLQFSNGGHSPVIYCPAGGKAQLLKAEDLPLGIFKDHIYKNQDITINPGDVLIVATDGFNEARNSDGDMFGLERLLSLAERNVSRSAQTIAEVMFARIHAFSAGHPQDDDATIVVIKGMSMPASERGHTS